MVHKVIPVIMDFSKQMSKKKINDFAASTAFFLFLSVVPLLIMICTIIPYTPLTEEDLVEAVTDVLPDVVDPVAESLIGDIYDKSAGILSFAIIATLWSASKGVMALMRGLNAVNDVEEQRNFLVVRIIASFYTIVMLIVVILSLFVMVFGDQLVTLILHRVPRLRQLVSFAMNFRFLLVWALLSILFAALYAYVPNKKLNFREQIPGAVFASVVWSIFSWGFSSYVTYGNSYGIYGSLAVIIIVLLWMYFCMYIIMIGAYLNQYFEAMNRALVNGEKMK